MNLRQQLNLVICTLIIMTMVFTLGVIYSVFVNDYGSKVRHNNAVIANNLANNVTQFLHNAYNISGVVAQESGLDKLSSVQQTEILQKTTRRWPFFQLMAYTDLKGMQISRSSGELANRAERWWFKKFMAEKTSFISKVYYSISSGTPITTIVHGVYDKNSLIGMLMTDIEIIDLQKAVEEYAAGMDTYAYLLDEEGTVIAHPDKRQVSEMYNYKTLKKKVLVRNADGLILTDEKNNEITNEEPIEVALSLQSVIAKVMTGEQGEGEYTEQDGEGYMCAYRTIPLKGSSSVWSLIVVHKKSMVRDFMRSIAIRGMLVGITAIVISTLFTFWFLRRITGPLLAIVEATNRIKGGDFTAQVGTQSTKEMKILAENFNQMVYEIRQHRERLEDLVEARTSELGSLNQELTAINETLEDTNQRLNHENEIRRQAENNLVLRERQYRAITRILTRSIDETEDILETILKAAQIMGAKASYIGFFAKEGQEFYVHMGIGIEEDLIMRPQPVENELRQIYTDGEVILGKADKTFLSANMEVVLIPLKKSGKAAGLLAMGWGDGLLQGEQYDLESMRQFGDLSSIAFERITNQKKIRKMAFTDTLTGLPNRASLRRCIDREMEKAYNGQAKGAILFIDMDDLKAVNDSYGHSAGDKVIIAAGNHIIRAAGEEAFVAHIGGDEFNVIIRQQADREQIAVIAERILQELHNEYEVVPNVMHHMSASIGIAVYPEDGASVADILKNADSAMYAAKRAGRNRWRFYEPKLLKEAYEKIRLTNGLHCGVEKNEFVLYYQPQYQLNGSKLTGFEALLRWKSAEFGFISPEKFIPLAEESGLIVPIGKWILKEACLFAKRLADSGQKEVRVAVNISTRQLLSDGFSQVVAASILAAGIEASQLELEITESVFIESMEEVMRVLYALREIGVTLALDDFGTGYSSLTYLKSLPVDILKIDKSFIDHIHEDNIQVEVVGAIINLGHTLGLKIVAEGVEINEQLLRLETIGCDYIQGYIFSKPLPPEQAISLLG